MIKEYLKLEKYDAAIQVFNYISLMEFKPNDIFFNKILDYINKKSCNLRITEYILNIMITNKIKASLVTFNTLLDLYIRKGDYKMTWHLFDTLASLRDPAPDNFTYSIMINGIKNMEKPDLNKALELFEIYKKTNKPDLIIYNSLLDVCISCRKFEYVWKIHDEIKAIESIKCDEVTYNTLIKGCSKLGEYDQAALFFQEMKSNGVKPNKITYNSMMDLFVKKKDFNGLMATLEMMKSNGLIPDQFSYSIVLNGIKSCKTNKDTFKSTMSYITQVIEDGTIKPDEVFYNSLIDVCIKYNEVEMALSFYEDMQKKNIIPSPITFGILIKVFGRKNDLQRAFGIFEHMRNIGHAINVVTYGCILDACTKNNRMDLGSLLPIKIF